MSLNRIIKYIKNMRKNQVIKFLIQTGTAFLIEFYEKVRKERLSLFIDFI